MLIGSELEDEREKHGTCALGQGNILTAILFSASESEVVSLSLSLSLSPLYFWMERVPSGNSAGCHGNSSILPTGRNGRRSRVVRDERARERDAVREKESDTERERQIYI